MFPKFSPASYQKVGSTWQYFLTVTVLSAVVRTGAGVYTWKLIMTNPKACTPASSTSGRIVGRKMVNCKMGRCKFVKQARHVSYYMLSICTIKPGPICMYR